MRCGAGAVRRHWPLIAAAAREHGLAPAVLAGVVAQESRGEAWATRPEPLYRWLFGDDAVEARRLRMPRLRRLVALDLYEQRISYGLCQVMGAVARELGWSGWLTELCRPEVGLAYGARHLANLVKAAGGRPGPGAPAHNGGGDPLSGQGSGLGRAFSQRPARRRLAMLDKVMELGGPQSPQGGDPGGNSGGRNRNSLPPWVGQAIAVILGE